MNMNIHVGETVEVPLQRAVSSEPPGNTQKESDFLSRYFELITVNGEGTLATLYLRQGADKAEVRGKAERYLHAMCKHPSGFDVNVVLETRREGTDDDIQNAHAGLFDRGLAHDYGKGYMACSGLVLRLARLINYKAAELYANVFDFQEAHFPAFIDHETLHKCGYIESHPHAVSFVGNVVEDFDALEAYRLGISCGATPALPPDEHIHNACMCLNPAACLPAHPTLEGKRVGPESHTLSWLGRVFRYESPNNSGLDRLYEFNVREIVFVRAEEFVAERRTRALLLVQKLAEVIDLEMSLQSAKGPFFATVSAAKKFFQQIHDLKDEILLYSLDPAGGKKQMAGGPNNMHDTFFGERFNIMTADETLAHIGYIGLRIERWVISTFTQHGFDPSRWPASVRVKIFTD